MADEYNIKIKTEADIAAARAAAAALEKVGEAAEGAAEAMEGVSEQQEGAATSGEDLSKTLETVTGGALQTTKMMGGMGKLLSGNLLGGVKDVAEGFRGLNVAMLANPAGKLVALLSLLAGAWSVVSAALKGTKAEAAAAATESKRLSEEMTAARESAAALGEEVSAIERMSAALKEAADQAERFRKVRDEMSDAKTGLALARTDLAEAQGSLTPDEARARRTGIRAQGEERKNNVAQAAQSYEKQRAMEQLHRADEAAQAAQGPAARAKEDFERKTQRGLATGAPLELGSADGFSAAKEEAARRLESAKNTIPDEGSQTTHAELIEEAEAQVDAIDEVAEAYTRMQETAKAAKEAEAARVKTAEEVNKVVAEANRQIGLLRLQGETSETVEATEQQRLKNDQAKAKKEGAEKFTKDATAGIAEIKELGSFGRPEAEKAPVRDAEKERRETERRQLSSSVEADAERIGTEAGGLKGRSTEATNRLKEAAANLKEGTATEGEADELATVLGEVAAAIERIGKDASKQRAIEKEVKNLSAQVKRLNSQQGQ